MSRTFYIIGAGMGAPDSLTMGYTNLDSEKGFAFFQKFLKTSGILDELERQGIQEGDTVRMYQLEFDYYK